eukprot:gene15226-biopygen2442
MQLHSNHCVACGVLAPDVSHHFWSCPVAVSVRREIEQQLVAFAILPAGANLTSAQIWLGCKPSEDRLHSLIWDMVCIAAVHAMDRGRATAWAVAPSLATPVLIIKLQLIDQLPGGLPARRAAYQRDVWGPVLRDYPPYADRFLALAHVRQLLSWIPSPWLTAAVAVYNAAQAAGSHPPACTVDSIADARQHLSAHLGWKLGSEKVLLADLSVALATRLQTLESHVAIRARHDQYVVAVAVRTEVEHQLIACALFPAGFTLTIADLWLGRKPLDAAGLHTLVWDMVCLAALHALDRGRCTAWAAAPSLATPVLVEQVAARAAVAAFWSALADFAATVVVPK